MRKRKPYINQKLVKIHQHIRDGVKPINAAIIEGLTPVQAVKFEEQYLDNKALLKSLPTTRDIGERRGVNIVSVIEKYKEAAGIGYDPQGIKYEGAMRTISAMNTEKQASGASHDFIDVPDWTVRLKALKELTIFTGLLQMKSDDNDDEKDKDKEQGATIIVVRAEKQSNRSINVQQQAQLQ